MGVLNTGKPFKEEEMDFSYSQQQLEIKQGIREWGKKHLTEEVIAD